MMVIRRRNRLILSGRWTPSLWLLMIGVVLMLSIADGRLASAAPMHRPMPVSDVAAQRSDGQDGAGTTSATGRPDFRATIPNLDDRQAGRPFSYTVQVRNEGAGSGAVRVTTMLPPEFTNVRVHAPGFSCSRQFTPSGSDAGTLVACTRNELASGATAEVTVEANAPSKAGTYRLEATADPRDEVAETDEGNNQVSTTVNVGV